MNYKNDFLRELRKKEIIEGARDEKHAELFYEAFNAMGDAANSTIVNQEIFNRAFVAGTGHRTLQQNSFRLILGLIQFLGSNAFEEMTDQRNRATHEVAKEMIELIGKSSLPTI